MNQEPEVLFCELCNAELPNFNSMEYHIQGKRHQNAVQFWERKKEQAQLSIIVKNFPVGTNEQELRQYFAQFGRVTRVSLVQPNNLYAIIEFSNMDTVSYVLGQRNHRLNSQNMIVKAREVQVPGSMLVNQFNQGGNYAGSADGPGWGGFGPGDPPRNMYQEQMWMDETQPSPGTRRRVNMEDQLDDYYHQELIEMLMNINGVQNQLEWLCQNLQITAEESQAKFQLCAKLQICLERFFAGCTVNQFGSSVNGYGLMGCDMDIFLDFTTMQNRTWELQPIKLPYVRDVKFLKDKEWGPLNSADMEKIGLVDQCKLISRILIEHLEGVQDVQVIPSNRCPLVRFRYTNCDIKCDLSVNNKLALQNTKLLYLYSVLNSRVSLLVYAIRYWGKVKGITGNNKASTKLSNYALILMVLNYLQNVEPPVLPTIEKLSQLHGPTNRTQIDGWDCTFVMDWRIIPQSTNTQSAAELLSGFFSYWSAFNFMDNVLITRNATEIPFTHFFEKDNMTDSRIRNFKAGAINIQDPFVLSHNITQNVNDKMREKIQRELRIAAIKTSVWGSGGFFSTFYPSGGGDLIHLLNNEVPYIILQEDQEKHEAILEKGRMLPRQACEFEFEIELKPMQLSTKLLKTLQEGENYRLEWCKRLSVFIVKILKEVLMLTEELPEATEEFKAKMAEEIEKKKAADKRNEEIRQRRAARRVEKKKELEQKMQEKAETKQNQVKDESKEAEVTAGEKSEKKENVSEKSLAAGTVKEGPSAGDKRPRPVGIADLEMNAPKKFRGAEETVLDINEIEDSDDGEEIIEYEIKEPKLLFKRESNADVNCQYFMRAWCMTWARRKKVKNYLVNQEGRMDIGLQMEKLISETIYQNDRAPLPKPVVGFYCYIESCIEENSTKVNVRMDCKEGHRDFSTFFQFTKMFLYRMIDKYFI